MAVNTVWMGGLKDEKLSVCVGCNLDPKRSTKIIGKSIMSILKDKNYKNTVYSYSQENNTSKITGEYKSYDNIVSLKVKNHTNGIKIKYNYSGKQIEYIAFPKDNFSYYTVLPNGIKQPIKFYKYKNKMYVEFKRWRLQKQ